MIVALGAGASSAVLIEPRFFVNETERDEFGESAGAFLNRSQQQNVPHPIGGLFDVAVHHRRGRWDAEFVRGRDDFDPPRDGQFVRAELAANAIIENFGGGAGNATESFILQHLQVIAQRHSGFIDAVGNFHRRKRVDVHCRNRALDGTQNVAIEKTVEIARQTALDTDFGCAAVPRFARF